MPDSPEKIQWHPAFCAAAGLELQENIDEIQLIPEYNLSKEPIRIDLLIMKDRKKDIAIKNEIGHIMKIYNVIEYKSPEDGMTIDDFSKTLGYACLYKGYGEYVNQIPFEELTISLFRDAYPREMIAMLQQTGFEIEQKYPGIYYVRGAIPIDAQIVVTSQLTPENHSSLRILSNHAEKEDIERFLHQAAAVTDPGERNNIMCQALQELMKDEIEEKVNAGMEAGKDFAKVEGVKNLMETLQFTAEQAMDALKIPEAERESLYKKMCL